MPRLLWLPILLAATPLAAQQWNEPRVAALVERAVERRQAVATDSALRSYRTVAHGFVFFLAQVGEGLTEPPRLVKADQLDVEVYWQAPDRSKQIILGWRDGAFLPTDIRYHRDHLGIVTNNFGNTIRIGEGDEVRDAVHPLSPAGLELYDFALEDSLALRNADRTLTVYAVRVRPRTFGRPLVVGTLFLEVETAELVRFRFSFTPAAYRDSELEDINVVLENSLVDGRYWLPWRQEVEIRRRTTWLDFPARGIIRGRWEIGEYEFNVPVPLGAMAGPAIGGLTAPNGDAYPWDRPLDAAVRDAAPPASRQDMDALRAEVERIAGERALTGLKPTRLAAGSISNLARVTRVQGLTLGVGATLGVAERRLALHPSIAIGTSDGRVTGGLALDAGTGATRLTVAAERRVRDLSDLAVISPAVNSLLAQEGGRDAGDYVLLESVSLEIAQRISGRTTLGLGAVWEGSHDLAVAATPANGSYRSNPPLGAGDYRSLRLRLDRSGGGLAARDDLRGALTLEGGDGPTRYLRATAEGRWELALGGTQLLSRIYAGWGDDGLPRYRSFVLGGRGTLVAEPFRAWGGRSVALVHLEWRLNAPVPAIPLGSFASTGRTMVVAPFVSAGWTERPYGTLPWAATGGLRPVAGVALEWFMRLIRVEAGVGLRDGEVGVTVDVNRDWWDIL